MLYACNFINGVIPLLLEILTSDISRSILILLRQYNQHLKVIILFNCMGVQMTDQFVMQLGTVTG